jgi:ribosome-associated protein YbcJ (S4-like RNA binding protein)
MRVFTFEIKDSFITLIRSLKASGIAENGSSAKELVSRRMVLSGGVTISEFRKKIYPGTVVEIPSLEVKIHVMPLP